VVDFGGGWAAGFDKETAVICLDDRAVQAWVRGDVPDDGREAVRAHLDDCESCRDLIATTIDTRWIGRSVGRYRIVELIGGGAMGEVYRAEDPDLGRDVAIKVVQHGGSQRRLLGEAQAMAKLAHPNVIRVYDVGTYGDDVFLAMELVQGRTLRAWFTEAKPAWRAVVGVMRQAGAGLLAAHEAGLVHGDFKPDNVLIASDGRVMVMDFGLARMMFAQPHLRGATPAALDVTCGSAGTPAYMAPEQFEDGAVATPACDQFSFCVSMFEALHGERPFAGRDLISLRDAVRAGKLTIPTARAPGRIARVLRRGLAPAAGDRFPSLAELLAELDAALSRKRVWAGLGVAGIGAAVGATLLATGVVGDRAQCRDGASQLDDVWDRAARDKLHAAFAASKLPYAQATSTSVSAALDRYRESWIATYTETCEATHVRGEQSSALLDTRMTCLRRRKDELRALVGELARGTPEAVRDSVAAVGTLRPVSDCANVASLQELEALPADAAQRDRIAKLDGEIARCRAQLATGQIRPALACATAARATANELGYRPSIAQVELIAGMASARLRAWPDADAALTRAELAAEESRDARTRARALIWSSAVAAERVAFTQAHERLDRASAVVKAIGDAKDLAGDLAFRHGELLLRQGKLAPASEKLQSALALREEVYGKTDARIGEPLAALAVIDITRKQFDAAKASLDRAMAIQRATVGESHPVYAKTLHALAQLQARMGKLDEALATQKQSYELLVTAYGEDHRDVALSIGAIAQAYLYAGKYELAVAPAKRSAEIMERASGPDHPDTAVALQTLGAVASRAGKDAEALAAHERVLAINLKTLGPDHINTTQAQVNLAMALRIHKRCTEALPLLDTARDVRTKLFGPEHPEVIRVLQTAADCNIDLGNAKDAVEPLERVVKTYEARKTPTNDDRVSLAMARFGLARALWDTNGSKQRATALARAAHEDLVALGDARAEGPATWAKSRKIKL
jgi:tetratricopeptide (TPR) repeat protein/predicted Ser/Thr protein kinase